MFDWLTRWFRHEPPPTMFPGRGLEAGGEGVTRIAGATQGFALPFPTATPYPEMDAVRETTNRKSGKIKVNLVQQENEFRLRSEIEDERRRRRQQQIDDDYDTVMNAIVVEEVVSAIPDETSQAASVDSGSDGFSGFGGGDSGGAGASDSWDSSSTDSSSPSDNS